MQGKRLKTKEFLVEVVELLRMQLPAWLRDVNVLGPVGSLIKVHYGNPKVHYEVWVRPRHGSIEVGLHFEAESGLNRRYLSELRGRHAQTVASLGPEVQPEEWVRSWTRVHQAIPFSELDEDTLMVVSGRLSQMVARLEPVVREISGP
ncbi:MAG: hypothetical protein J4F43_04270 [Dehalococcoidia bacterium]|nr:hypothetical protein [Dehalococcoidia bacterium]